MKLIRLVSDRSLTWLDPEEDRGVPQHLTVDELVLKQIEEAKLRLRSGPKQLLPKSLIPFSLKQYWSVSFQRNSQLQSLITTQIQRPCPTNLTFSKQDGDRSLQ